MINTKITRGKIILTKDSDSIATIVNGKIRTITTKDRENREIIVSNIGEGEAEINRLIGKNNERMEIKTENEDSYILTNATINYFDKESKEIKITAIQIDSYKN